MIPRESETEYTQNNLQKYNKNKKALLFLGLNTPNITIQYQNFCTIDFYNSSDENSSLSSTSRCINIFMLRVMKQHLQTHDLSSRIYESCMKNSKQPKQRLQMILPQKLICTFQYLCSLRVNPRNVQNFVCQTLVPASQKCQNKPS